MNDSAYLSLKDSSFTHFWYRARADIVYAYAKSFGLQSSSKILEIGCGYGSNLKRWSELCNAYGLDVHSDCVNSCATFVGSNRVLQGSWPCDVSCFGVCGFDYVFMLDVLEHIEDDISALQAVRSILSNTGYAIVTVPAHMFLWSNHDKINGHYRRYELDELVRLFCDCGFDVVHASYFNSRLYPVVCCVRFLKSVFGLTGSDESIGGTGLVNEVLYRIFRNEAYRLTKHGHYRNGSSIILCAQRKV